MREAEETSIVSEQIFGITSHSNLVYSAGKYEIYWLGITIVIGGQLIYWNQSLVDGFWPFFITTIIVGTGYACLTLCLAEMTSFLPFSGGSWGYARCALGPIPGFLVGVCETIEYVLYVTSAVLEWGSLMSIIFGVSTSYEPLYWLFFFSISLFIQIYNPVIFWRFTTIIAAVTLILILIYFFASIPAFDYHSYMSDQGSSLNLTATNFFYNFPLASWYYVGVEVMTLSCSEVRNAPKIVPYAMLGCMLTLLVTSILILFGSCFQCPGPTSLADEVLPLNPGYDKAFQIGSRMGTILAIPGTFATAFGFMFAYGRQIYSMSTSGLFPHFLSQTFGAHRAPISALFLGSTLSYGTLLLLWYVYPQFARQLFNLCMLGSCSVYIALFRSYLVCQNRYSNLPRQFTNRLGGYSAGYGMIVFILMFIALAFFQRDRYVAIIVFLSFLVVFLLYYFIVVQKREYFSDEEQAKFMKAYILNASEKRKMFRQSRDRALNRAMLPLQWIGLTSASPSSRSAKRTGGNNNNNSNNSWLWVFGTSPKNRKLNNMNMNNSGGAGKRVRPVPSYSSHSLHSTESKDDSKLVSIQAKTLRSSGFARSINSLEAALEELSSSARTSTRTLPTSSKFQSEHYQPYSTVANHQSSSETDNLLHNRVLSIAMLEPDWIAPSRSRKRAHHLHYTSPRTMFVNVNGTLIHLTETATSINHC